MYIRKKKNERSRLRDLILGKNLCESRAKFKLNKHWTHMFTIIIAAICMLRYINGSKRRSAKTLKELNGKEIHSESEKKKLMTKRLKIFSIIKLVHHLPFFKKYIHTCI